MDEMIESIVAKTGISYSQAEQVARITIRYITDRLPAEQAGDISRALERAEVTPGSMP